MNWDRVEGNWNTFKGKVQQKWGKLTNDDLNVIEGKRTELSGRLQQRYGPVHRLDSLCAVAVGSLYLRGGGVVRRAGSLA